MISDRDRDRAIFQRAQYLLEEMIPYSWFGPEADGNMVANQAAKFVSALADAGLLTKELPPLDIWIEENYGGLGMAIRRREDPPINQGRANADEWHLFLSEHKDALPYVAVQIVEAIEAAAIPAAAPQAPGSPGGEEARAIAFRILQRHPDCLRDDVVMNDLIEDIASAISPSPAREANGARRAD